RDVEDPAAARDEPSVAHRGSRMEDQRALALRRLDALDRRAGVPTLGIALGGENDGDRGGVGHTQLDLAQVSGGGRCECLDEVALDAREDHLGLGVAEAAVELEYPWPVGGEHEPCVEAADERRASL